MGKSSLPRLGTFFVLIGLLFSILFVGSLLANEFNFLYLFLSVFAFFIGTLLHRTVPRPEPTRFSSIRKASAFYRQRRGEGQEGNDQKK